MELNFILNGKPLTLTEVDEETTLLQLLRDRLGLTGAKRGCDTGVCGACSVLVDGRLAKSCRTPLAQVDGHEVTTIEGLRGPDGDLSALQTAFLEYGAVQCGFCTPGMVIAAEALLRRNPHPTRAEIRRGIAGNICRCTGYQQIVDAIEAAAAQRLAQEGEEDG
ncbi:MAG: (2Fe-2S)-binding protein [Anaerolineae bacterium]|nr:(2Fe-2S)-binding protein [Anaerolineae bacterium]